MPEFGSPLTNMVLGGSRDPEPIIFQFFSQAASRALVIFERDSVSGSGSDMRVSSEIRMAFLCSICRPNGGTMLQSLSLQTWRPLYDGKAAAEKENFVFWRETAAS